MRMFLCSSCHGSRTPHLGRMGVGGWKGILGMQVTSKLDRSTSDPLRPQDRAKTMGHKMFQNGLSVVVVTRFP